MSEFDGDGVWVRYSWGHDGLEIKSIHSSEVTAAEHPLHSWEKIGFVPFGIRIDSALIEYERRKFAAGSTEGAPAEGSGPAG